MGTGVDENKSCGVPTVWICFYSTTQRPTSMPSLFWYRSRGNLWTLVKRFFHRSKKYLWTITAARNTCGHSMCRRRLGLGSNWGQINCPRLREIHFLPRNKRGRKDC
jgi:hypothetical protein